jgi:hypothetical protein
MLKTEQVVLDAGDIQMPKSCCLYDLFIVVHVIEHGVPPWGEKIVHKSVSIA